MTTEPTLQSNSQALSGVALPAEIREDDRTSKFRITDKHGNLHAIHLGADLFNLFAVPVAITQQLNDELQRIIDAIKDWEREWKDHIEGWELYPREGAMKDYLYFQFIAIQKGVEFDKQLAAALSKLDCSLYDGINCSLIRVTVLMVPNVSEEDVAKVWA